MKYEWNDVWKNYKQPSNAEEWLIAKRNKTMLNLFKISSRNFKKIKTLEVGCGFASNSRMLKKEGADVFCLDNSKVIIEKIRKNINKAYIGDAFNLPFKNNYFDLVFSSGLLEHFKNPEGIIKEMFRVANKNGIILNFVPGKYSLWQIYRRLRWKKWVSYEESYTHEKLSKKIKNALKNNNYKLLAKGGLDPFSIEGFFLKLLKLKIPANININKNAYTEIYQAYVKI